MGRPTAGLEQIERADGIHVEVVKWPAGGKVVARLRSGMNYCIGTLLGDKFDDTVPVANIKIMKRVMLEFRSQAIGVPIGIALRSEEIGAHVVVDANDVPSIASKRGDDLAANQAASPGN